MLRTSLSVLFAVAFLVVVLPPGTVNGLSSTVRVGVYQNKPKVFIDENGRPGGIFVEMMNAIAVQEGWNVTYVPCEWTECLSALEDGRIDLMTDVAYSQERDAIYDFHNTPVLESWSRVYASPGTSVNKFSDLNGKRVAVLSGSIQQTVFQQMMNGFGYSVTIVLADSLEKAFAEAADGSADAAVANHLFGNYFYRQYGLVKTTVDFNPVTLYFAAGEGRNRQLLDAIDRNLDVWIQEPNSPYYQILARWMDEEVEYRTPQYVFWIVGGIVGLLAAAAGIILLLRGQVLARTKKLEQTNAELQKSEEMLRLALDASNDGIWDWYLKTGVIYWSPRCYTMLGYIPDEFPLNLERWVELLHPDDRENAWVEVQREINTGDHSYSIEFRFKCKDGGWAWINSRGKAVAFGKKGDIRRVIGTLTDITERKQHEREREAIIIMANALRAAPTRADMVPVILDQLLEILHAEGAALIMRDPATGDAIVEMARGEFMRDSRVRMPPGEGVSGQVIATGKPFLSNDIRNEPRFTRPDLLKTICAAACIPLIAQGQGIGALWLGRKSEITPAEVRLLSAVADMAANAINRATLHEQTERQVQRLAALHSIDAAISSSMNLPLTLNILLGHVTGQLGVDAAAVLLLRPQRQMLEYTAGRGFHTSVIERTMVRLGEGQAGTAALERRIILVPNLAEENVVFTRLSLLASEKFQAYACAPLVAKGQVKGVLEIFHRSPVSPDSEWLAFLEMLTGQAAIAIDNAEMFEGLQRSNTELSIAYDATIEGWSRALELRDRETEGHTQRVMEITIKLARVAGISEKELIPLCRGVLLHDIGKMGVPDNILLKPGPLSDAEWSIMRQHPQLAYDMLSPILYLKPALDIPYCHHEKWDGTGYPRGLKAEAIPIAARLFAVVDVWDALRSDRPYRSGWPEEKVIEYIKAESGTHFDPQAVRVFLRVISERTEDSAAGG
jgi:PAS domain S-box-containing protein